MDDGKTNRARDLLAVGHDERIIFFFLRDAGLFKRAGQHPGEFAAGVNQQLRDFHRLLAVNVVFHFAIRVKCSHAIFHVFNLSFLFRA